MQSAAPADWKPKVGERVVAKHFDNWFNGSVSSVTADKAKIKWVQSYPELEVEFSKIAPYPQSGATSMPAVNSYVLAKPDSESGSWDFAIVTAVNGQTADIKLGNGKTRTIKADEYVSIK